MFEESDVIKASSRLSSALENNTVDTLSACDFRIFIECTRKGIVIHEDIVQEVSKNLFLILSSGKILNNHQNIVATAYCSMTVYCQKDYEKIFQHFVPLLTLKEEEKDFKVYLCHAILQLNNTYWANVCKSKDFLLQAIFKILQSLCWELKSTSFLCFKVLYNLLFKMHEIYPDGCGFSAELLKSTLEITMCNWENPLTGVRQQNSLVLSQLLLFDNNVWDAVLPETAVYNVPRGIIRHQRLLELILTQLPWTMKSKYFLLTVILQKSDVLQILTSYRDELIAGLLLSLSVPYLVSAGTDLYRAILAALSLQEFEHYFLSSFTRIVTDSNCSLEMENLFNYWMQHTIKKLPVVLDDLLQETSTLNLYAYIFLHKIGRKEGFSISRWDLIEKSKIRCALEDYSDKFRSQAFALVCIYSKTSVLPSNEEFDIVEQFLRQNVNSDSAVLRQSVLNSFTNFIIRIRDALLYFIKLKQFESATNTGCFSFLDWLHSFLLFNLGDKCNYQRKITSLEIYKIILIYFGDSTERKDKSYIRKSNKDHLSLKTQESNLSWKFKFESESSRKTFFNCLFDEDNYVRTCSATILMSYFQIYDQDFAEFENLFQTGLSLCSCQMFYKAESGALITQVLVTLVSNSSLERFKDMYNGTNTFLSVLLSSAETQLQSLQADLLRAASQGSFLYGTLHALDLLLTDPASPESMMLDEILLGRLILLMEKAAEYFIAVLSSKSDSKSAHLDYAPSFGEMGMAIAAIVERSSLKESEVSLPVADEILSDLQLTPAQQLVLSCVWLNLKAVNKLCSSLVNKPLNLMNTERCISVVVSVLRRCRHKGAIESAGVALYHITRHITSSADPQMVALATQLMSGFLQSLVDTPGATVSRRSAGLAILVHRLITGDARPTKPLLHHCVSRLLLVAADSNVVDDGMLVDLPQSQALHFLRTLVQESSLREHMAQYTLSISLVSVTCLTSPIWTIRNAALQLFGALVPKMVGQKPHQEEGRGSHHLPFEELYTHAKPLVEMMLNEFSTAARSNCMMVHSKVMPLLTLTSNLTVGLHTVLRKEMSQIVKQFREYFQQLFKCNIFYVRKLSAKSDSLFVSSSEIVPAIGQRVNEVLAFLTKNESCIQSENELHGSLLNISYLVQRFNEEKVGIRVLLMLEGKLSETLRMLTQVMLLGKHSYFVKHLVFELKFQNYLIHDVTMPIGKNTEFTLGFPHFINKQLSCVLLTSNEKEIEEMVEFCLIKSSNYDIQLSCLKALKVLVRLKSDRNNDMSSNSLKALFIILKDFVLQISHTAESSSYSYLLALIFEIMMCLLENLLKHSSQHINKLFCSKFLIYGLELLCSDQTCAPMCSFLLPIICGSLSIQESLDLNAGQKLATMIKNRSNPDVDQDMRIHAAKSMAFLVPFLKSKIVKERKCDELIWESCVDFLQDEVIEVRYEASRFVTIFLSGNNNTVWNPFLSLERLFAYSCISKLIPPEQALECFWGRMLGIPTERKCEMIISNPFDHGVKSIYAEETIVSHLAYCGVLELTKLCNKRLKLKAREMCNNTFKNKNTLSANTLKYIVEIETSLNANVSMNTD